MESVKMRAERSSSWWWKCFIISIHFTVIPTMRQNNGQLRYFPLDYISTSVWYWYHFTNAFTTWQYSVVQENRKWFKADGVEGISQKVGGLARSWKWQKPIGIWPIVNWKKKNLPNRAKKKRKKTPTIRVQGIKPTAQHITQRSNKKLNRIYNESVLQQNKCCMTLVFNMAEKVFHYLATRCGVRFRCAKLAWSRFGCVQCTVAKNIVRQLADADANADPSISF